MASLKVLKVIMIFFYQPFFKYSTNFYIIFPAYLRMSYNQLGQIVFLHIFFAVTRKVRDKSFHLSINSSRLSTNCNGISLKNTH